MEKKLIDNRKEKIIDACEKLYKEIGFKNVNIKLIGENISCSRTSIYNYFETKEEIFLALVEREYLKWNKELLKIYDSNNKASINEFVEKIVKFLSKRKILLKLISMNMYEMEENSSYENVKKYKIAYIKSKKKKNKKGKNNLAFLLFNWNLFYFFSFIFDLFF